ncbi:MAG: hypothetical protein IJB84_03645 [Lachnospiraceae bacterium]|nr:hypothetical protein [Lachnospiraceae bacterium]
MGYTTTFKGKFKITPYPSSEFIEEINLFSRIRHNMVKYPGIWCQWIIDSNGDLVWNGMEKFYHYTEWLQYLINEFFSPYGYELNGKVNYRGERMDDFGVIYIKANNIRQVFGGYDPDDEELIISISIDKYGKVKHEIIG